MCLKKRCIGFFKKVISLLGVCSIVVFSGLSSVSVSALSSLHYDLYNCTYEVIEGLPFDFQVFPDIYTPSWNAVTETMLRFPYASYDTDRWDNVWTLHIKDDSIQFSSDQVYNFSFWVDLYGYPFTNAGLGIEGTDFAPDTLLVNVCGQETESRKYVHQGSSVQWDRLTYAVPVEVRNYTGSLDMYIKFYFGPDDDCLIPGISVSIPRYWDITVLSEIDQFEQMVGDNYTPPDTGSFEDYKDLEQDLTDSAGESLNDLNGIFDNVVTTSGFFGMAFYGFSTFFNKLTSIPIFSYILNVSVAIGLVGLFFGLANSISGRFRS